MPCGVPEAGRQVAEGEVVAPGDDVEGHAERSVATADDGGRVGIDALAQPRAELIHVARGGDVQVGIERAAGKPHRAPDMVTPRAAGRLVEEDGGARRHYGRAARISAACSSLPVRKYTVSSLT
jgi:hypothetical protein